MPRWLRAVLAFLIAPMPLILLAVAMAASRPVAARPIHALLIGGFFVCWLIQILPGLLIAIPAWRSGWRRWWQFALVGAATYGGAGLVYTLIRAAMGLAPLVVVIGLPIFLTLVGAACGVVARLVMGDGGSVTPQTALDGLRQTFD